jgi:hypothetical protein
MTLRYREAGGLWVNLPNASYRDEEELRTLLVESPNVVSLTELPGVDSDHRVTIGREAPLGSGYADLVWVDLEGRLTVVEVKLRSNPEMRREVLAQALSYAAFLEGMSVDEFVERVAGPFLSDRAGLNGVRDLTATIGAVAAVDLDLEAFSAGLADSLRLGRFRILIVVDEPHQQLRRSVAYVNRHADFEIYLVEVGFYQSEDGRHQVLAPRILDVDPRPVSGSGARRSNIWDRDSFLIQSQSRNPDVADALSALHGGLATYERDGLVELEFGTGQEAVLKVQLPDVAKSLLWVRSSGSIQFPRYALRDGLGWPNDRITRYMEQIAELSGASPSKYERQEEPQVVSPDAIVKQGVVPRILDVVAQIARRYRWSADEGSDPDD